MKTVTENGWRTIVVPQTAPCPDGVFIEDPVVVYKNLAVVTRPSVPSRQPEVVGVGELVGSLGYSVHTIEPPGTLEGGDVLIVRDDIYVGQGGRSNVDGIEQLRAIVEPEGAKVTPVPMGQALHLKSAVTALPDGTFIGHWPALADPGVFPNSAPSRNCRDRTSCSWGGTRS